MNMLAILSYLLLFYYFASSEEIHFPLIVTCFLGLALFHFFAIKPLMDKKTLLFDRQERNDDQTES